MDLINEYNKFLDSQCPWTHYVCNVCNYSVTHPLNYCYKCPNKIIHTKVTWLDHIKFSLNNGCIGLYTEYSELKDKVKYPNEEYWILLKHLRIRLKGMENDVS